MKKLLLLFILLSSALTFGQGRATSNYPSNTSSASGIPSPSSCGGTNQYYVNTSNGDLYVCPAGSWVKTGSAGGGLPALNVQTYGALGDGSTDDSTAVIAAIQAAYNANGGIVYFPPTSSCYRINSQLSIPNNAAPGAFHQPAIRLTGAGGGMAASAIASGTLPVGGSCLDLRNNATTSGKILTLGAGYLEIDHLSIRDLGADSAAFVYVTNTTVHIHDNDFFGTAPASAGVSANNDAIVLGGTDSSVGTATTSPFQGYGTVIRDNFFNDIKRGVFGQSFVNGVQIVNNTGWISSGYATGGMIELQGLVSSSDSGNYIAGNLCEISFYKYCVHLLSYSTNNAIIGNSCFDSVGNSTACVGLEANADYNLVIASLSGVLNYLNDVDKTSTFITPQQSVNSISAGPHIFTNTSLPLQVSSSNGSSPAYDILNTGNSDELYQQLQSEQWTVNLKPLGATAVPIFQTSYSATTTGVKFGKSADTAVFYDGFSGADVKVRSLNAANVVWLCGGNAVCNTWVDSNGQLHNNRATGTAPLVITSTTPVTNLSLGGGAGTSVKAAVFSSDTNCSSSASPAVCGSAAAGSVAVPTGTNATLVVNTTAVTANSQIMVQSDETLGTKLSVTCNSTLASVIVEPVITARVGGTSFTITISGTTTTNPVCLSYFIVN